MLKFQLEGMQWKTLLAEFEIRLSGSIRRLFTDHEGIEINTVEGLLKKAKEAEATQHSLHLQATSGDNWKRLYYQFGDITKSLVTPILIGEAILSDLVEKSRIVMDVWG